MDGTYRDLVIQHYFESSENGDTEIVMKVGLKPIDDYPVARELTVKGRATPRAIGMLLSPYGLMSVITSWKRNEGPTEDPTDPFTAAMVSMQNVLDEAMKDEPCDATTNGDSA